MVTTWNPSDKSVLVALSGSDLVATGSGTFANVRATQSKTTGKWYGEVTITNHVTNPGVGVGNGSASLNDYLGYSDGFSAGYFNDGVIGYNNVFVGTATFTTGDIIQWAFDADAQRVWFGKNGTFDGSPSAGTGATDVTFTTFFPMVGTRASDVLTGNFGATAFAYIPPSGFTGFDSTVVTLTPSLFTNTNTLYAPTVTPGTITLAPSLFTNTNTFYGPEVQPEPDTISVGSVFWPSLNPLTWSYGGLLSTKGWFDPLLIEAATPGTPTLYPALFTNTNAFYSPTITTGSVTLTPSSFTNTNTFYSPTVSQGGSTQTLTPLLFTNSNAFFSPTVTAGAVTLSPGLFTNANTFFAPTVTRGTVTLAPSLFANTNSFFAPTVTATRTLSPSLFTNSNTFFAPTVTRGTVTLSPALFANVNTFYGPTVGQPSLQTLSPALFANVSVFYGPTANQNDPPGTYPLAIEGNPTTTRQSLSGGGSVVAGSIPTTGRVVAGSLRGRP